MSADETATVTRIKRLSSLEKMRNVTVAKSLHDHLLNRAGSRKSDDFGYDRKKIRVEC